MEKKKEKKIILEEFPHGYPKELEDLSDQIEAKYDVGTFRKMETAIQFIFESYCKAKKIPFQQIGKILLTEEQVVCYVSTFEDGHIEARYNLFERIDKMAKEDVEGDSWKNCAIFYMRLLIHEYVHAYLSLNQVKYPKEYGKIFSVAQHGLNVKKTILKDGIQIKAQTETHDLDEGFTEFIAIVMTSSYFGFEIDDKTFEFFYKEVMTTEILH